MDMEGLCLVQILFSHLEADTLDMMKLVPGFAVCGTAT